MNAYAKRFKRVAEGVDEVEVDDRGAMAATLDQGAAPEDYDVQAPVLTTKDVMKQSYELQAQELQTWIDDISAFIEFINGNTTDSIQSKLHSASCDTMFEKIASSESKKISRTASELSALVQSMKGYLISNKNS